MRSFNHVVLLMLLVTAVCGKSSGSGYHSYIDSNSPIIQVLLSNKSFSRKWSLIKKKIKKQTPKDVTAFIRMIKVGYPKMVRELFQGFPTFRQEVYDALHYSRPGLMRDLESLNWELRNVFTEFIKPALFQFSRQLLRLDFGDMFNSASHTLYPDFSKLGNRVRNIAEMVASSGGFGSGEIYAVLLVVFLIMIWQPGVLDWLLSSLLGPLLMAFGATVLVRAFANLGMDRFSIYPAPVDDASIVMSGMYATVRHPMYAGLIAMVLGLALTSKSIARLALLGGIVAVILAVVEVEEELLLNSFPTSYGLYMRKVSSQLVPGVY